PALAVPAGPRPLARGRRSRARRGRGAGGPWPGGRPARSRPGLQPAGELLRVADEVDAGPHLDPVRALVAHAVDVGEVARLPVQARHDVARLLRVVEEGEGDERLRARAAGEEVLDVGVALAP